MRYSILLGAMALLLSSALLPAKASSSPVQESLLATASAAESPLPSREVESPDPGSFPIPSVVPPVPLAPVPTSAPLVASVSKGTASWYGPGFFGNRTANGEVFRPGTRTAAHRTLPFGTRVRVTNLSNGRSTVVRINDRGPFHGSRVIDLAHGAAEDLGVTSSGLAPVRLEVLR